MIKKPSAKKTKTAKRKPTRRAKVEIRRRMYAGEWWFVINDVVRALSETPDPKGYLKRMRRRSPEFAAIYRGEASGKVTPPPIEMRFLTAGGRQPFYCWNTVGIVELIKAMPSRKITSFKIWLDQVGADWWKEIEDEKPTRPRRLAPSNRLTYVKFLFASSVEE